MNIQQMKYVVEVDRTGSISQAADNLFMGQPNLSKAIKELELSLGIRIFKRTSRGVSATADGARLVEDIKNILRRIEDLEARYKTDNSDTRQSFSISAPPCGRICAVFTALMTELANDRAIDINFGESNYVETINNIEQGGCRLGIIRYPSDCESHYLRLLGERNMGHKAIWEFESMALMSSLHKLAKKAHIELSDLKPYIEINGGCDTSLKRSREGLQDFRDSVCAAAKSDACKRRIFAHERSVQMDLLCGNFNAYLWAAPLPDALLSRLGLVQKSCVDFKNTFKDVLIFTNGHSFSELELMFIKKLESIAG